MSHMHDALSSDDPPPPPPPPPGGSTDGYDAFISYRSTASVQAKRLRDALVSLAKTHSKDRPFRVFLDTSSLLVGDLSDNIKGALQRSHALVLLLAKDTVESHWVNEEIAYWLSHGGDPSRLYLVRVDDVDLSWSEAAGTFAHPELLPAPLATAFETEQKYVDLSTLSKGIERAAMVPVFAAIRGIAADELRLDEAAAQRRARVRNLAIAVVMTLLLVAALIAGWWALQNRNAALAALQVSQSRQLAALSQQHSDRDIGLAGVLALGSYQLDQNAETQTALTRTALGGSFLARIESFASEVTVVAGGTGDDVVVAGLADGDVVRWDTDGVAALGGLDGAVQAASSTLDGSIVLAATEETVSILADGEIRPVSMPEGWDPGDRQYSVLVSPDGSRAWAGVRSYSDRSAFLCEVDLATGGCEILPGHLTDGFGFGSMELALDDSGVMALFDSIYGRAARIDLATLARISEAEFGFGTYQSVPASSPDGTWLGVASHDTASLVSVWTAGAGTGMEASEILTGVSPMTRSLAIAPSGTEIALSYVGGVSLVRQSEYDGTWLPTTLDGAEDVTSLQYQRDGRGIIGVRGDRILFWDLDQVSRVPNDAFSLPSLDNCAGCGPAQMVFSPDESKVAVRGGTGNDALAVDTSTGEVTEAASSFIDFGYAQPVWLDESQLVLPVTPTAGGSEVTVPDQPAGIVSWARQPVSVSMMAAVAGDGGVLAYGSDGVLRVHDASDGSVLEEQSIGASAEESYVQAEFNSAGTWLAVLEQDRADPAEARVIVVGIDGGEPQVVASGDYVRMVWHGQELLVQRADGRIEAWGGADWTAQRSVGSSTASLIAADSSGHSSLAALRRLDNSIDLMDTASGQLVTTFSSSAGSLYDRSSVAFTPVTGRFAILREGGEYPELAIYDLSPESLAESVCRVAWTALVPDRWGEFAAGSDAPQSICEPADSVGSEGTQLGDR